MTVTLRQERPPRAVSPASPPRARAARWKTPALGLLLVVAVLALWQLLAYYQVSGAGTLPGPWGIVRELIHDRSLYATNIKTTLSEALPGLLIGAVAAIIVGVVFEEFASVERLLSVPCIALLCTPMIALAPILYVVFAPYTEKLAMATVAAFFPVLVATLAGMKAADPMMMDVVRASGGRTFAVITKVKIRSAVPSIASGVQIAFPSAILGAMLGEFAGGSSGLGVFMMNSLAQFNPERTWGAGAVATVIGTLGFALFGFIQRRLASGQAIALTSASLSDDIAGRPGRRSVRFALTIVSIGIAIGGWWGGLKLLGVNSYFGKTPADVWKFLFVDDGQDGAARADIWHALGQTIPAALAGGVVGLAVAYVAAVGFLRSRTLERLMMPMAMVLQSVPLQAMTPLIVVVLGRGAFASSTVAVLVCFFPSVVLMTFGLRDVPQSAVDVFHCVNAGEFTQIRKLRTPAALPKIFGAARIGLPGALMGVLTAEYLATGQGVGFVLANSAALSKYSKLWTATVIITLVSVVLYAVVARAERWAQRTYGGRG
jgi:ABC-type nitrate/sulfonate/bicarbonate transport system permease component